MDILYVREWRLRVHENLVSFWIERDLGTLSS